MHYHSEADEARAVVAEIEALGRRAVALGANVGDAAEAQGLVAGAVEALGHLDILVNNAGVEIREPFLDVTEAHYDLVLDVNLKGAFFAAQAAARHMVERGEGGRIVNVSSIHEDVAFLRVRAVHRVQGRHAHGHAHHLPGARAARDHRQRHRPGRRRHADQQAHARRRRSCCTSCRA